MAGLVWLEPYVRGGFSWQGAALCASVLSNGTRCCLYQRRECARIRAPYLTKWPRADSIWFGEAIGSHCVTMNGETAILLPYDSYKLEYAGCGTRR